MLQNILTALIVLAASGYSLWRLAPAAWRKRAAVQTSAAAHAALPQPLARRIEIKVVSAAAQSGSCGSCGPCKACKVGAGDGNGPQPA